jgi:beta-barrel assembly-enhancing protease
MTRWCLFLLAGAALAQQPDTGRGVNFYSCDKERALGAQLAGEYGRTASVLDAPAARQLAERVGNALRAKLPAGCAGDYTFQIVGGETVLHEPVAFPGGYLYVPAGLILSAASEAEFAGMLAHAMAHIAARHGTRLATRGQIANQASIPLIFMGGWTGSATALPLGFVSTQRQLELDADRAAAAAVSAAGYDPEALVRYIRRNQSGTASPVFSALPPLERRVPALQDAIAALPPAAFSAGDGLAPAQDELRRLPLPPAAPRRAPSLLPPPDGKQGRG